MTIKEKLDAVVEEFGNVGIVPVIKLDKVENAEKLAKALRDGGINCAEVTFRAKGADEVIRRMTKAYPDMFVGAGTVLTCEQADTAYAAGAKFCVAPGLNPKVVNYMFASHKSYEIGYQAAMDRLGLTPMFDLGMRLGEGSGCPIAFKIIETAVASMNLMKSLEEASINGDYLEEIRRENLF